MIDTMDKHSCELFLEDALEIGRRLVETGAEVKRVEDTVRRICIAYGFTDCEIYAVTSLIVATIRDKDGNTFVAGFVSGLLALGLTRLGLGHQADKIMIGDIMLLIPGLLLVNAIKEMFNRDIVTGLYRLIEAVLVALAIAGGYALAFLVMGGAAA